MEPDGLCIYEAGRPHECHWCDCKTCPVFISHNIQAAIEASAEEEL